MSITITPSPEEVKAAISSAVDRAHSLGYADGKDDGYKQGFTEGATSNDEEVFNEGYNQGYGEGFEEGKSQGGKDYDEGYDDGYDDGKSSMIDPDKIIEKTATGTGIVSLDDVSELPHDISVQLIGENVGGKQVTVYNGNLCDLGTISFTHSKNVAFSPNLPAGTLAISAIVTSSFTASSSCILGVVDVNGNSTYPMISRSLDGERRIVTFNATAPIRAISFYAGSDGNNSSGQTATYKDIMISWGVKARGYIPYEEPLIYTANADGKVEGIKSISPYMTLICDNADVSVDYQKSYGMQTEYDRFWDAFQDNGRRTIYSSAFAYGGWGDSSYNPKYTIKPTSCNTMFLQTNITDTKVDIDLTGDGTQKFSMFQYSKLKTIRKLIVKESNGLSDQFTGCSALKHITFEGVIGQRIDFQWCPLSRTSIDNIFDHLKIFDAVWTAVDNAVNYEITQDSNTGAYPCDVVKVVLREGLNPADYFVIIERGEDAGNSGQLDETFDENGVYLEKQMPFAEDNSGYFRIHGVRNRVGVGGLSPNVDYTVYEGKMPTPKTATFKKTAVNSAYETSEGANNGSTSTEWKNKVDIANNNGWTIELI